MLSNQEMSKTLCCSTKKSSNSNFFFSSIILIDRHGSDHFQHIYLIKKIKPFLFLKKESVYLSIWWYVSLTNHTSTKTSQRHCPQGTRQASSPVCDSDITRTEKEQRASSVCVRSQVAPRLDTSPSDWFFMSDKHGAGVIKATGQDWGFEHPQSSCDLIKQPVQLQLRRGRKKIH